MPQPARTSYSYVTHFVQCFDVKPWKQSGYRNCRSLSHSLYSVRAELVASERWPPMPRVEISLACMRWCLQVTLHDKSFPRTAFGGSRVAKSSAKCTGEPSPTVKVHWRWRARSCPRVRRTWERRTTVSFWGTIGTDIFIASGAFFSRKSWLSPFPKAQTEYYSAPVFQGNTHVKAYKSRMNKENNWTSIPRLTIRVMNGLRTDCDAYCIRSVYLSVDVTATLQNLPVWSTRASWM